MDDVEADLIMRNDGTRWRYLRQQSAFEPCRSTPILQIGATDVPSRLARSNRRQHQTIYRLLAVAAVIITVLVPTTLLLKRSDSHINVATSSDMGTLVSYHGVSLYVPHFWRVRPMQCGPPLENVVVPHIGAVASCPTSATQQAPSGYARVDLMTNADYTPRTALADVTEVNINGMKAIRGAGVGSDTNLTVLRIRQLNVAISVTSPNPQVTKTVLSSVRRTPIDVNGCKDRVPSAIPRKQKLDSALVPPFDGTSVVACEYMQPDLGTTNRDHWLAGSAQLNATQVQRMRAIFASLADTSSQTTDTFWQDRLVIWYVISSAKSSKTRTVVCATNTYPILATDGRRTLATTRVLALPGPYDEHR